MKLYEIKIRDNLGQNVKFTQSEMTDLALFRHDKGHASGKNYKGRNSALEKALKMFSKVAPDLWRGIYQEEMRKFEIGEVFSPKGYMSLSEHRSIAESFAKYSKSMTLIHIKGLHAFPYGQWNIEHLQMPYKIHKPDVFKNNDMQHSIDRLTQEAEWIVGHDTKFEVISKSESNGFAIIEVKEV